MGGTGVAALVRTAHHCGVGETAHPKPLGLGSSGLPHQPLGAVPRGARNLQRQWTTAKPLGGDVSCNVLPFFLDLSLAFAPGVEFFDAVKSSVDSEVVFQATLQVPAHHALACRLNAYGTPFAAPDLQAAAHELRDEDLEFAACLATPPDLDEQLSVNFGRVMSMLEKNQGQGGAQIAARAAPARPAAGTSAASVQQQQLRSTGNQQATAPKVLVSVDEAETTAAQLQRQNSAKKQPKLQALMDGYGKRALQAMLGLGYLLTVLHEKTLGGGRIEFSAAASIISPATSDSHHLRPRVSNGLGVLAGLRSFVRECPSLSPLSPSSSMSRRQQSAAAAAAAAAAAVAAVEGVQQGHGGGSSSSTASTPTRKFHPVSSFEAAWDRVLNPPLLSSAGGSGGSSSRAGATPRGQIPACQTLQLQLSLSAPYRRMSMEMSGGTPGSTPRSSLSPAGSYHHQQEQEQQQQGAGASAAAATAGSGGVPHRGSPLAQASGGVMQAYWQQQQQRIEAEQQLHKAHEAGRGGAIEAILDSAIEQLHEQRQEASATDLVALVDAAGQSPFAQTAAAAGDAALADSAAGADSAAAAAAGTPPCTPIRPKPPLPPRQQQQQQQQQPVMPGSGVRSFYLADQSPLTSPMCSVWGVSAGGGVTVLPHGTPFGSPWVNVSTPNGASAAGAAAAAAGQEGQGSTAGAAGGSSMPGTPQRMLLPVMSMRLTCQPSWQYNGSSTGTAAAEGGSTVGSTDAAAGGGEDKVASGDGVEYNRVEAQQEQQQAGAAVPEDAAAAADISRPSLTLANFIAAADGTAVGTITSTITTSGGSSSSSTGGGSSARRSAVHMHQPTADELRSRALAKLQEQQQQQQQQQARQQGVSGGSKGLEEAAGTVGGADDLEEEDGFDESAMMASPISYSLPQGLWPTMSFSLVPVRFDRLPPASPKPNFAV